MKESSGNNLAHNISFARVFIEMGVRGSPRKLFVCGGRLMVAVYTNNMLAYPLRDRIPAQSCLSPTPFKWYIHGTGKSRFYRPFLFVFFLQIEAIGYSVEAGSIFLDIVQLGDL